MKILCTQLTQITLKQCAGFRTTAEFDSVVVMIVDEHTLIHCSDGKQIYFQGFEGRHDGGCSRISKAMTKSIPSQARAYRIIVKSSPCGGSGVTERESGRD